MANQSNVIDLTNSFILEDHHAAIDGTVIEINDSLYELPPPRSPPRRTRSPRTPTTNAQYPIEIVDTPVEDLAPGALRRNKRSPKNAPQATQSVPTDDEVLRDRSALDNIGTCAICLDKFKSQPLISTMCGHVFCENCLESSFRNKKKCPTCRKSLSGKNAYHRVYL